MLLKLFTKHVSFNMFEPQLIFNMDYVDQTLSMFELAQPILGWLRCKLWPTR